MANSGRFVPLAGSTSGTLLPLQVCDVLFSKAVKYDDLYSALTSLLAAGSQFDTLRRKENKNVTALVSASPEAHHSSQIWARAQGYDFCLPPF